MARRFNFLGGVSPIVLTLACVPALAQTVLPEIRVTASLRWGSQAIGGVVNVDNNRIPTSVPLRGFAFESLTAATSVDSGLEGAASLDAGAGNIAVHADVYGRRAADYRIPTYPYLFPDPVDPPAGCGR